MNSEVAHMKTLFVEKTASKGIAIGKAYVIEKQDLSADLSKIEATQIEQEIDKYNKALKEATLEIEHLAKSSDIFQAHLQLIRDIALYDSVLEKIKSEHQNAQLALESTMSEYCAIFDCMEDEYMRERSADIKDICNRLIRLLKGIHQTGFEGIHEQVILIAEDLTPSDTSVINMDYVLGFATELGGVTSHVSIIAKNLGLPSLVGVRDLLQNIKSSDFIIIDASKGNIIINPDSVTIHEYQLRKEEYEKHKNELELMSSLSTTTPDGRTVKVYANVGNLEDIRNAVTHNIDGIGLFRSEFLYMDHSYFPIEEEQFEVYKEAALLCNKLVIRTLDIGGDKALPYYTLDHEENPSLGWRGIRISLDLEDVFKAQVRAILRASAYGNVKIMYPMIISMEELTKANSLLTICKEELSSENLPYDANIKIGIMVETPAAVLCIENFVKNVDFVSIGTNDLTQYVLAVDRGNKKIANRYNSFHPAVIQSIKRIIDAAHAQGIEVGMCGEFASDEKATALLLGLGLDEFSMSAGEVANIKNIIRNTSYEEAKLRAKKAASVYTIQEVMDCIN